MITIPYNPTRPDIFTSLDDELLAVPARHFPSHAPSQPTKESDERQPLGQLPPSTETPSEESGHEQALKDLEDKLPYGAFLLPNDRAYERAIFIGNLLYKMKTPAAVVLPRNVDEVVEIVNTARMYDIQLTVKNGGHSYAGYCLNEGGIVMDLSVMKNVEINEASTEVKIEAGCIWKDVYKTLVNKDRANMIIGGQCPYVGVSGFTLGGGLSPFSRSYGLGVDNVTEMTVVTAAGEVVTLTHNEKDPRKRDLFWALRGGGGGNFGVLVEMKSKVHRLADFEGKVVCGQLIWQLPQQQEAFDAMMQTFNNNDWPAELTIDAIWAHVGDQLLGQMTVLFNGNSVKCYEVIRPLLHFKPFKNDLREMVWGDWMVIEEGFDIKSKVYHHHSSFIFGEGGITQEVVDIVHRLVNDSHKMLGGKGKSHFLWDHYGKATTRVGKSDTAFFWRDGVYAANFKLQWTEPGRTDEMLNFMARVKRELYPHTLEKKAAYLNYIDSTVDDWEQAYYGDNYERLQKIKTHWDPSNLFRFEQSIKPDELVKHPRVIAVPMPIGIITIPSGTNILNWAACSAVYNAPPEPLPDIKAHAIEIAAEPQPDASTQTKATWARYALPNPDVLWKVDEEDEAGIYDAIAMERIKILSERVRMGVASS